MKKYLAILILPFFISCSTEPKPELVLPVGHLGNINSVSFSSDGKYALTSSTDRTAKLWDARRGRLLHSFEGHSDELFRAVFSGDEKMVVTISRDRTVRRWDIVTGKEIMRSQTDLTINSQVPANSDASVIMTSSGYADDSEQNMNICLWNTKSQRWKLITKIPGNLLDSRVSSSFNPAGKSIAIISNDGFLILADYNSGKTLQTLEKLADIPQYASFSPNGRYFLSLSNDSLKIWESATGKLQAIIKDGSNTGFSVSHNSNMVAIPSVDGNIRIYDLTGKLLNTIGKDNLSPYPGSLIFSDDDKNLLIDLNNASLILWDISGNKMLFAMEGSSPAAFSKDGRYIITSANYRLGMWAESLDQVPKIWDARNGRLLSHLEGHAKYVSSTQFSPDGEKIITGSYDRSAKLWDLKNGKLLNRLKADQLVFNSVEFSRDGKYILTTAENQAAKVWNVKNGNLMLIVRGDTTLKNASLGATFTSKFSPDSKLIVTSWSTDESVKIFDIETGSLRHEFICPTPVTITSFSNNSGELAVASGDRCARIWDLQSGRLKYIINDADESLLNSYDSIFTEAYLSSTSLPAKFSPDSKTVITSPASGITEAWDVRSGKLLYTIKNVILPEYPFSRDSKYFITVSQGDSISQKLKSFNVSTVRDLKTGSPVQSFKGNANVEKPFSSDKSKIITTSSTGDIYLWNLNTGALINKLPTENPNIVLSGVAGVWFSPVGDRVISHISGGNVNIWDSKTGQIIKTIEMEPGSNLSETFSPDGMFLLQSPRMLMDSSANNTTHIWDIQTLKQIQKFNWNSGSMDPASVTLHSISPDGSMILTGTGDETTKLWDIHTGEVLAGFKNETGTAVPATGANKLTGPFSPDSKKVMGTFEGKTRIWDIQKKSWLPEPENAAEYAISYRFTPDSKMLIAYSETAIKLWDVSTGKQIRSLEGSAGVQFTLALSDDATKALATLNDGITWVWDLTSGEMIRQFDTVPVKPSGFVTSPEETYSLMDRESQPGFRHIVYSPDDKTIVTTSQSSFKIWNSNSGKLVHKSKSGEIAYGVSSSPFSKDGKMVAADFFITDNASQKPEVETHIIDIESGETKFKLKGQTVFLNGNASGAYSPDGETILTQSVATGFRLYNASTGQLKHELGWKEKDRIAGSAFFSPDSKLIIGSSMLANDQGYIIKYEPLDLWDAATGKKLKTLNAGSSKTMDINWQNGKIVNVMNSMVTLIDIESGKEQVSFVAVNDEDYVFILPSGEYMGTTGGVKYLSWRLNNKLYDFDQWDLQYNRPDRVLEQLGNKDTALIRMYHKAYLKRLKRAGFSEEMLSPEWHTPEIKILNQEDFAVPVSEPSRELKISITDSKYLLDRINVWINDVPVYGRNGLSLRGERTSSAEKIIPVALSSGTNKIQVSGTNEKGVESLKESVDIICNPPVERKPDLYVLAMSVSEYKDNRYNLEYAVKDGRDIASVFDDEYPDRARYGHVYVDTIFNTSATRENFSGFRNKLLKTGINDQVVVFVSGHGLLDRNMDFYFATHDIDFNQPEARGISFDDLEDLLDSIPARKKLLMMDACHSGEVDKEEQQEMIATTVAKPADITFRGVVREFTFKGINGTASRSGVNLGTSFDLMQELFTGLDKGTGTVVIAAAAGKGYALESKQWNNGVFTFTILNGLKNKAADKNNDKKVSISELKDYSIREVEELTSGKQKPTSRREAIATDWIVW